MYRTVPIRASFSDEEQAFWLDQCQHANSLINCAIYYAKQSHYAILEQSDNAFTTYWRSDELRNGWKIYKCRTTYPELDKALKDNPHYKAMAAQSAQQTLKTVGESITSYNGLVNLYYRGEVDRPSLPKYRKRGGLAAVTFPRQALTFKDGCFYPSISKETKPHLITDIALSLPEFIDSDWVKEVTIRPCYGHFWIDWVIDDGKQPIEVNPNLDYTQAWSFDEVTTFKNGQPYYNDYSWAKTNTQAKAAHFYTDMRDHGGNNWLTGVSTLGTSFIIDGAKLRSMNQGYSRLVAKYKEGKSELYWDENLERIQLKRNNQMRDGINKAARFIINRCLADRVGNIIIGWNEGQKNGINLGKRNNQNLAMIPTKRLIERLKQLCPEYGIKLTITEESYTSQSSFLDDDFLPKYGEKPNGWKPSGERIERGLYKSKNGIISNADCVGAANIMRIRCKHTARACSS